MEMMQFLGTKEAANNQTQLLMCKNWSYFNTQMVQCYVARQTLTTSMVSLLSKACRGGCSNGLGVAERLLSLLGEGVCSNCVGLRLSERDTRPSFGLAFSSREKLESVDEIKES